MELGIAETMEALRAELAQAVLDGAGSGVSFPVDGVSLEFHVAVRKEAKVDAKVKFWVVEAGAAGGLTKEEIHKVTITLGAPTGPDGGPVKISRDHLGKP